MISDDVIMRQAEMMIAMGIDRAMIADAANRGYDAMLKLENDYNRRINEWILREPYVLPNAKMPDILQ